jgi:hypothetical protein
MWDCIDGVAARGGLGVAQPWPATAEDRLQRRGWPSAARSVQQGAVDWLLPGPDNSSQMLQRSMALNQAGSDSMMASRTASKMRHLR